MKNFNILFISLIIVSCGAMVNSGTSSSFTVEKGRVPADFMKEPSTLVLLFPDDKDSQYEDYLRKAFDEFYTGEKIYIYEKELKDSKYADLTIYRYTFRQDFLPPVGANTSYSRVFLMRDRVAKKDFKNSVKSGFYGAVLKGCAQSLEETRIANNCWLI